ncbi:cation diffusion facilitator family transporter [Myxococcota bacterium]|nr:cation diffusion facilitator family transporter [Myxococcota bacterium]MCZ7617769.1 cation diffusion facilitator family transporter [Myxococcota bacterium]
MAAVHAPLAERLEYATRLRAGWLAVAAGLLVLSVKILAWRLTGSAAVLSDALESIVNVVAGALLLLSLYISMQPADHNHPYGHGKVEFFSVGVEGTLIAVAALWIAVEAIRQLVEGPQLRKLDVGLLLVSGATVINAAVGAYLIRVGRRAHSLALVADGEHLLTDVVTSVGVIAGLGAVWISGWELLDPLVALGVAAHILKTGWGLLRQSVSGLMDEADPELLQGMVDALEQEREPWCIDAHSLRAWRSGSTQHVDLHLVVPRYFDADRLHRISEQLEVRLLAPSSLPGEAIVHFDPCRPRHCSGCAVDPCPVRAAAFRARSPFTLERATRGDETLDTGTPIEIGMAAE